MLLILGAMPAGATPQTALAAGPWCFAGQEALFPGWEKSFAFAPEPLASQDMPALAARGAQTLCLQAIPRLGRVLSKNSSQYPAVYWQTLLMPWAICAASQIVERALRCQAMIDAWGKRSLNVPLLSAEMTFNFWDEQDFRLRGGLGTVFNHWLFSRLLENRWPTAWTKAQVVGGDKRPLEYPASHNGNILQKMRSIARNLFRELPYPRLKGISLYQSLRYSLAMLHKCKSRDHSLDLDAVYFDAQALEKICLPEDVLPLFLAMLPESIGKLEHPASVNGQSAPRLRIASIAAYEDARYRQKLACWRARGGRLAYVQHGGNYGQIRVACDTELVEYSQDAFFTWGWKKQGVCRGNFIPLPYPQLVKIADKWHGTGSRSIIFVGTEMAAFGYRLDSRPTPLQFVAYRNAKADFMSALDADMRRNILYRPYFNLPGTLEDAPWLLARFPELNICTGPLQPQILACGLLVLDHHGTTMLEAFAANTPTILYWDRKSWPLCPQAEALLDMLEECGIWHGSPRLAARKLMEIGENPSAWWHEQQIQKARLEFCRNQARIPMANIKEEADSLWLEILKSM